MKSMTGFGTGSSEQECVRATATVRSVNHKFLDIVIRMPEAYRSCESRLRERIVRNVARGRLEVRVEMESLDGPRAVASIDPGGLEAVKSLLAELQRHDLKVGPVTLGDLLRVPELVKIRTGEELSSDAAEELLISALEAALAEFQMSRAGEGRRLREVLGALAESLVAKISDLRGLQESVVNELQERFQSRLADLLTGREGIDQGRLAQETAFLVERSDVREELDRLEGHLEAFQETLFSSTAPAGKRLDFVAQEILRELNTMAAKCRQLDAVQSILDAKLLCDQIREQVQNVE